MFNMLKSQSQSNLAIAKNSSNATSAYMQYIPACRVFNIWLEKVLLLGREVSDNVWLRLGAVFGSHQAKQNADVAQGSVTP